MNYTEFNSSWAVLFGQFPVSDAPTTADFLKEALHQNGIRRK
jgi:hypothetical protein